MLAAFCACASAARLVWDANTEPHLRGYKIHYGSASGQYTETVDVGNVTEWPIPDSWPRDRSYYFAATAYAECIDAQGQPYTCESGYSNEAIYLADAQPPAAATDVRVTWRDLGGQTMGAPTLVSTTTAAPVGDSTTLSWSSISWQTGDDVYVLAGAESGVSGTINTPSVSGLSFSLITATNSGNNNNYSKTYLWKATAGSNGSGAISSTKSQAGYVAGVVYVVRGTDGTGNTATLEHSGNKTVSLTRAYANSLVFMYIVDWNAVNDTSVAATPSGTVDQAAYQSDRATFFGLSWGDQGATGSTSYGLTNHTGTVLFDAIAVEVRGSAAAVTTSIPSSILSRQRDAFHHMIIR